MSAFPPSRYDHNNEQGASWQRPEAQPSAFVNGGMHGADSAQHGGYYPPPPPQQPSPYVRQMPQMYPQKTNVLAIITLVTSIIGWFFISPFLGMIALKQIKRTGEGGRGYAKAGIAISILWVVACLGYLLLWILAGLAMSGY